ncbi:hypothetical protein BGZ60DRAFT_420796 [Tricladium varicosporioides]|nr:hypothetical protein BGZ60DRAFT_420796 [Hymenoscyphus varicosporioides]
MAATPDLTLPATEPSVTIYQEEDQEFFPIAVYTLADLSDTELQELQQECESECEPQNASDIARLAPQPKFVDQPLKAVYDYHLELAKENVYFATKFIVAVEKEWRKNGVVIVTLDEGEDGSCKVDQYRIKASNSALVYVNQNVGNSAWDEDKESYEITPGESGDGGDDDDDQGGDGAGDEEEQENDPTDAGTFEEGPKPPKGPPGYGNYIGVYTIAANSDKTSSIIDELENLGYMKSPSQFICRMQAIIPNSEPNPVETAFKLHPQRCERNPWLNKLLFFVVDTTTPKEDGIVLASVGGVGEAGQTLPTRATKRVHFSTSEALLQGLLNIERGLRVWEPSDQTFGVWRYNTGSQSIDDEGLLLDPEYSMRKQGDERVLFAPFISPGDGESEDWDGTLSFELVLKKWPLWAWWERFRVKFPRNYYICSDNSDIKGKGVLLVKVPWDGDVSGGIEKMKELELDVGGTEVWRVPVREAWQTLKDVVDGKRAWEGKARE